MVRSHAGSTWRPTVAHARAVVAAVVLVAVGVVARRPDLLVLAAPFAVVAAWATVARPGAGPEWSTEIGREAIREGWATRARVTVAGDGCDLVAVEIDGDAWTEREPDGGAIVADASTAAGDGMTIDVAVRATRWGLRRVGPVRATALGPWGGFRADGPSEAREVTCLPVPGPFDAVAPFRPADGLVGPDRSIRLGEGGEFAAVRAFQPGDRLRRINWPRSLRSRDLQVNATWADDDNHLALVLDATGDFGVGGDAGDSASSLDTGVRAAAAIAEHSTRRGDRVSLHVVSGGGPRTVPPGTGSAQARRILGALAAVRPAGGRRVFARLPSILPGVGGSALIVVLSPLVTDDVLERVAAIGRRGLSVVVVDTLPEHLTAVDDPLTALAWRIRLLERRRDLRRIRRVGVPVVRWRGAGSLDEFLWDLVQRTRAPRVSAR